MYPTLNKIREIAASGKYKRIPVCREIFSDSCTPVEVMRILRKVSRHWKVPEGRRSGEDILFLDMILEWRSPVLMAN